MSPATGEAEGSAASLGVVLAGGGGTRMGGAKAEVELAGRPLIDYPLRAVVEAGLQPLVIAKQDSELPALDCEVVLEPAEPHHPLCGIVSALRWAGGPVVVLGCDMPFSGAGLLARLASAPEPLVACALDGGLQPLPGRYDAALLRALERALENREPLRRSVESLGPRLLDEAELKRFGDPRRLCFNVNSPADLQRAERMLERA
jgi:molybdopterin-guanine dinucleotide biosynthesis protein A